MFRSLAFGVCISLCVGLVGGCELQVLHRAVNLGLGFRVEGFGPRDVSTRFVKFARCDQSNINAHLPNH